MGKKDDLKELVNILVKALRHKIGSLVNAEELYAGKYAKDAEMLVGEAEKVFLRHGWNRNDKKKIRELLLKKLKEELKEKEFLNQAKFEIMETETDKVLQEFGLLEKD